MVSDLLPAAYRVAHAEDAPADRLVVTCVRCGAIYACLADVDRRPLVERAFGPRPTAQRIMAGEGHGVGGWCIPARDQPNGQWGHALELLDQLGGFLSRMEVQDIRDSHTMADVTADVRRLIAQVIRGHYETERRRRLDEQVNLEPERP